MGDWGRADQKLKSIAGIWVNNPTPKLVKSAYKVWKGLISGSKIIVRAYCIYSF
jgi:hypothetical protein